MRVVLVALFGLLAVGAFGAPGQEAVETAVRRGVVWLRKEQKADGSFGSNPGETALALMALRHSGVPASDRACEKAARNLERALPDGTVYGAALGTLALLAQSPERHRKKVVKLVGHLSAGQCRNGQWSYAYRSTARKKAGDNSNTQLAILALAGARARRFEVDPAVFQRCRGYFLASQNEDGGYGYAEKQRRRSYGSMTAGGAMALSLCAAVERKVGFGDAGLGKLPEVQRAVAWLAEEFDPARNRDAGLAFGSKKGKRSDSFWRHYWLWSVERACAATGLQRIGRHDWYGRGAQLLLDRQQKEGFWRDPERPLQATCFALLFLRRSTRTVITPRERDVVTTPR
ncbi:MAG: prenyltransferase/squalene oxidase repeat-containing protein [Planctomycetota bacterium]|jgi:hypothetical protein